MRILFIVPYVPNRIRVRPYNLIRELSARGHRVSLATLWTNDQERQEVERLRQICEVVWAAPLPLSRSAWNCVAALPTRAPLQSAYCWQPELASRIKALTDPSNGRVPFDVVHVEHLRGARYGLDLRAASSDGRARTPLVWDSVDCISLLFRQAARRSRRSISRWLTRFELNRTEHYEGWLLGRFDRVLVTSKVDRDALKALAPNGRGSPPISVLRNGVDLTYFKPDARGGREPASLVMTGKMSYHANVTMALHFVRDILPLILSERPDVRLWIVGKDPPREVVELSNSPNVTVTGTVEDLRPFLQRATMAVAPITYGVGIQNKVLEAMACGTPVVASQQAVSALETRSGHEVLVAREPEEYAQVVLSLLDDLPRQRQIGDGGYRYVRTHHQWSTIAGHLEEIYHAAISLKR